MEMVMKKFSFNQRTAITTSEEGKVEVWTADGTGRTRLFKNSKGAAILKSDDGRWWDRNKKEADYCNFAQYWMGEYPYSSWCFALRLCKITGEAVVTAIETEINSRGATESDLWKQHCKTYVPQVIAEGKLAVSVA
jgi:hypothetical protein